MISNIKTNLLSELALTNSLIGKSQNSRVIYFEINIDSIIPYLLSKQIRVTVSHKHRLPVYAEHVQLPAAS